MQTITITFGDQAENHVGMEKIGAALKNNSFLDNLDGFHEYYLAGYEVEHYDLSQNILPAELLIVKNYLPTHKELFSELSVLDWDKKAKMYGRVVNKKVRHNLIFADFDQEPDYEKGKGRVYDTSKLQWKASTMPSTALEQTSRSPRMSVPVEGLNGLRANLERDLRAVTKQKIPIVGEGNYYYNSTCNIGYHGDTERKLVMGVRLGSEMRLLYQWHKQKEAYGEEMEFILSPGDLYIMSSKAIGNDWKQAARVTSKGRKRYALRHAAKF